MTEGYIGRSMRRVEDRRFLTGRGRYIDGIDMPGQLHGIVVRSPHGHAMIEGINAAGACALPGVYGSSRRRISMLTASGRCPASPESRP